VRLKKIIHQLHLILGLISGIIVFIVALTGCLYVFKSEIESFTQPYRNVEPVNKRFLPPSELKPVAQEIFPGKSIHGIAYGQPGDAAEVLFYQPNPLFYQGVIINPYSGEILKIKNYKKDFFQIIFNGHFQLWLPRNIGKPIVATAVLVFVVMLITGLILWWPKKKTAKQSFRLNWNAPWQRKFYDLHSVLGFYAHLVLLVIALTGLVWGFQWVSKAIYKSTGGNKELTFQMPTSDTSEVKQDSSEPAIDYVWTKMMKDYPNAATIEVHLPHDEHEAIYAHVNPEKDTYWKTDFRYFDQHTLEELEVDNIWGKLENADLPDIIRRMNYDIHVGAIGGLPGKIIAFFASFIAATLPVTGIAMWWNKQKEKNKLKSGLDL
jgi:uncharacterized iron-regulated membrane protein